MIANEYSRAIEWYLGYDPGEKVQKRSWKENGEFKFEITEWSITGKKQPTLAKLEEVYNDNIEAYETVEDNIKKQIELKNAVKEKIAEKFIIDNNITSIEDLEGL